MKNQYKAFRGLAVARSGFFLMNFITTYNFLLEIKYTKKEEGKEKWLL